MPPHSYPHSAVYGQSEGVPQVYPYVCVCPHSSGSGFYHVLTRTAGVGTRKTTWLLWFEQLMARARVAAAQYHISAQAFQSLLHQS